MKKKITNIALALIGAGLVFVTAASPFGDLTATQYTVNIVVFCVAIPAWAAAVVKVNEKFFM